MNSELVSLWIQKKWIYELRVSEFMKAEYVIL